MGDWDKVYIVGIGEDGLEGLTERARRLVTEADILIGENHTLGLIPPGEAERVVMGPDPETAVRKIQTSPGKRIVVLAVGDPLFYGTAQYLFDRLGEDRFEVIPHVSTMQLAFARIKESWEDAYLTNLAGPDIGPVIERIRVAEKVGLFTSEEWPPSAVAKALLDSGIDYFGVYVCENLGSPNERVTRGELADIIGQAFSPLNVMILVRKPFAPDRPAERIGRRLFGNPDEAFLQSKPKRGLLTPAEIRAIVLAELDLAPASVVWDVGAGSGSVAVEAAQIAREGTVYAIEMDPEDHSLIIKNAERFGVRNLVAVLGRAPEAWKDLPDPDAVFIGGTGRVVVGLVEGAFARLRPKGRLVTVVSSIDNLADVYRLLHRQTGNVNVRLVQIARGHYQLERMRFHSLNPAFVIGAVKS
ncbi:MAG: precorrin-6y C5,15-methyltransferase (decarboxylating) subunit CbiE [Thermoguttaceae bacterium]|nr:precorrin-6y C5,15-methyltransferase (decarboxylating) subunit CbiE [Thermoguttaceae bacterium]MDW8077965.1 precorrin-6y C5,15-methyltransferase (decarboxylating) subunit CbiE [Thermoguttaceae bacterium]